MVQYPTLETFLNADQHIDLIVGAVIAQGWDPYRVSSYTQLLPPFQARHGPRVRDQIIFQLEVGREYVESSYARTADPLLQSRLNDFDRLLKTYKSDPEKASDMVKTLRQREGQKRLCAYISAAN